MARDAHRTVLPLAIAILTTVTIAGLPEARSEDAKPVFNQLVVKFQQPLQGSFSQDEQLQIESSGQCWYKAEGREARPNVPARDGGVFDHMLSVDRIQRLNKLLKDTQWLKAKGAEGPAPHTDAGTITLTLKREGEQLSVVCHGRRPEPYAALLHELESLATQERRIYLHGYVSGKTGTDAWQEIARELAALRGEPYMKPPFTIEYERYLPIAKRIVRDFYGEKDDELIPAVRLVGHFKVKSELKFLHRMAHDRSSHLRAEVAWALRQCHDSESLPVLADMMSTGRWEIGFELIQWGDEAVPHIVNLIDQSTNSNLEERKNIIGENMIRDYLDNWNKLHHPIDPRVVAAVRKALETKNQENSIIRTQYHIEFLKKIATDSVP